MRIPDDLLNCTVFLGGRDAQGELHYRATALVVSYPTTGGWDRAWALVTARHNVEGALDAYGNVSVRINTPEGGAEDRNVSTEWLFPDDPAADIAATVFYPLGGSFGFLPIPTRWFVTEELITSRRIGIGDDLFVMGLFAKHVGKTRNLPIVRNGNLAAMPQEPLVDEATRLPYKAYLAEVRSIGGLSGSPVFLALNPATRLNVSDNQDVGGQHFYLLGLIRGHWSQRPEADFGASEAETLNTGIAIVTPITDILPVLEEEVFVKHGQEVDKLIVAANNPVEDFAPESSIGPTAEVMSKLLQVPKDEADDLHRSHE